MFVRLVVIALTLCALLACETPNRDWEPYDAEARTKGVEFWAKTLQSCGESRIALIDGANKTTPEKIIEVKGFLNSTISDSKRRLTDVDKLNGLEWAGQSISSLKAYRTYENGKWSEWQDATSFTLRFPGLWAFPVTRKKGEWRFEMPSSFSLSPLSCDKLPPG